MPEILIATLALTLSSLTAVLAAERFAHRLRGLPGWSLALALAVAAWALLRGALDGAAAAAAAVAVLMAALPAWATWLSWRQKKQGERHGQ